MTECPKSYPRWETDFLPLLALTRRGGSTGKNQYWWLSWNTRKFPEIITSTGAKFWLRFCLPVLALVIFLSLRPGISAASWRMPSVGTGDSILWLRISYFASPVCPGMWSSIGWLYSIWLSTTLIPTIALLWSSPICLSLSEGEGISSD